MHLISALFVYTGHTLSKYGGAHQLPNPTHGCPTSTNMHTEREGCQHLLQDHHPHRLDKTKLWVTSLSPSQEEQERCCDKGADIDESPTTSTLSLPLKQSVEDQGALSTRPAQEETAESPLRLEMKNVEELLLQSLHKRHIVRRMNKTRVLFDKRKLWTFARR